MSKTYKEWLKYYENATKEQIIEDVEHDNLEIKRLKEDNKYLNKVNIELSTEKNRLNNIIKRLEEFIEKETEIYTLELTEKNTNALSYSLPIKAVYKEIYNVLQELKGSDKE